MSEVVSAKLDNVKDIITSTIENKAKLETKREGVAGAKAKGSNSASSFIRTSKILFKPNSINQVKQTELSNFIDLCNDALHFYVVYFAKYYELDKLLFIGAKDKNNKIFAPNSNLTKLNNIFYELRYDEKKNRDCFGLKLKFYPDEILEILTNEKAQLSGEAAAKQTQTATQAQISELSTSSEAAKQAVADVKAKQEQGFRAIAKLSARTLKSVKTQAMGIIRSWVQQILQSYQFGYFNRDQYKKSHRKNIRKYCDDKRKVVKNLITGKLRNKGETGAMLIDKFEFNSINCQLLRAEIDDSSAQFDLSENSDFDLLFCLNSMYSKSYISERSARKEQGQSIKNNLSIPLSSHHHFNELKSGIVANVQCKLVEIAKSILVSKEGIEVRFKFKPLAKKAEFKNKIVGIDQGQRKLFTAVAVEKNTTAGNEDTIGNEKTLKETDLINQSQCSSYNYRYAQRSTYNEVCDKIARRQKGSKGFKRAQSHRKNLINQAVNLLSELFGFEDDVAEVHLEKLRRLGEGKKKSRKLQAFNYADLRHKLERKCQETNVMFTETSNAYRSQRCSLCGFVHKKNRLNGGEEFKCIKCGYAADADYNSAKNQVANLLPIYANKQNRKRYSSLARTTGFYWLCETKLE